MTETTHDGMGPLCRTIGSGTWPGSGRWTWKQNHGAQDCAVASNGCPDRMEIRGIGRHNRILAPMILSSRPEPTHRAIRCPLWTPPTPPGAVATDLIGWCRPRSLATDGFPVVAKSYELHSDHGVRDGPAGRDPPARRGAAGQDAE